MENYLAKLISPLSSSEFFDSYQKKEAFMLTERMDILKELEGIPFLNSIDDLIQFWPVEVDAYLPGLADEINSAQIPASQATFHFSEGRSLLFNDANRYIPTLENWLEGLKRDLGVSSMSYARNLIYATPAGGGTAPHFDQNINFVLQLKGTKRWWVAANEYVENPLTRYTIGTEVDPEMASYTGPMPEEFPEEADEFELTPGSLLFVPRGAWHKTEAMTDSLALNFTFTAPAWLDILTAALRGRLAQSAKWRETADFVTDPLRFGEAVEKLDDLLKELAEDVPSWRASDILDATEMGNFPGSSKE